MTAVADGDDEGLCRKYNVKKVGQELVMYCLSHPGVVPRSRINSDIISHIPDTSGLKMAQRHSLMELIINEARDLCEKLELKWLGDEGAKEFAVVDVPNANYEAIKRQMPVRTSQVIASNAATSKANNKSVAKLFPTRVHEHGAFALIAIALERLGPSLRNDRLADQLSAIKPAGIQLDTGEETAQFWRDTITVMVRQGLLQGGTKRRSGQMELFDVALGKLGKELIDRMEMWQMMSMGVEGWEDVAKGEMERMRSV